MGHEPLADLNKLPLELFDLIFKFSSFDDVITFRLINKLLHRAAIHYLGDMNRHYKKRFLHDFPYRSSTNIKEWFYAYPIACDKELGHLSEREKEVFLSSKEGNSEKLKEILSIEDFSKRDSHGYFINSWPGNDQAIFDAYFNFLNSHQNLFKSAKIPWITPADSFIACRRPLSQIQEKISEEKSQHLADFFLRTAITVNHVEAAKWIIDFLTPTLDIAYQDLPSNAPFPENAIKVNHFYDNNNINHTPIELTIIYNRVDILKYMLEKNLVAFNDAHDIDILYFALSYARREMVKLLLDAHYPLRLLFRYIDKIYNTGQELRHKAISLHYIVSCHEETIQFIEKNKSMEDTYLYLTFFLRAAADRGELELFTYFCEKLQSHADLAVKFIQEDGEMIMEICICLMDLVHLKKKWISPLIDFLTLTGTMPSSLWAIAKEKMEEEEVHRLFLRLNRATPKKLSLRTLEVNFNFALVNDNAELVDNLLKKGLNPNHRMGKYREPVIIKAIQQQCPNIVENLLFHGAKNWLHDNNGNTPLIYAAYMGSQTIVEGLLKSHADPNQANWHGATPLLIATERRKAHIITLLIAYGADPEKADKSGMTPLMKARELGLENIFNQPLLKKTFTHIRNKTL